MSEWNKTSKFLTPTIISTGEGKEFSLNGLQQLGLENVYLDDFGLVHFDWKWYHEPEAYYLYCVFNVDSLEDFASIEETLRSFDNWTDYYDVDDSTVVHIFKVASRYNNDVERFRKGQYSKFSQALKDKYNSELAKGIVNKSEATRRLMSEIYGVDIPENQEYMSIPTEKDEIFRYE